MGTRTHLNGAAKLGRVILDMTLPIRGSGYTVLERSVRKVELVRVPAASRMTALDVFLTVLLSILIGIFYGI